MFSFYVIHVLCFEFDQYTSLNIYIICIYIYIQIQSNILTMQWNKVIINSILYKNSYCTNLWKYLRCGIYLFYKGKKLLEKKPR